MRKIDKHESNIVKAMYKTKLGNSEKKCNFETCVWVMPQLLSQRVTSTFFENRFFTQGFPPLRDLLLKKISLKRY